MFNKKSFIKLMFIFIMIISLLVPVPFVWADEAAEPAGDESATFTSVSPDALIVLDLSGSMAFNPAGDDNYTYGSSTSCVADKIKCSNPSDTYYVYSSDSTCTPDTVNCPGSPDTTRTYGYDATCTANDTTGACAGTGSSTYIYARNSSCTPDYSSCTGSDCSGGFCKYSNHSGCTTKCTDYNCSGGFCGASKNGCSYNCNCKDGMCHNSRTNCSNQCATNKCVDGFCSDTAQGDCKADCSRLAIAKRALFKVMDNDNNNIINSDDSVSLGIRIGFMRFKNGNDTAGVYSDNSNIRLVTKISELGKETGTSYSLTFCGNSTSCTGTYTTTCPSGKEYISCESPNGGTPLASSLKEAKKYLDDHKGQDSSKACRGKFVILITDGADTYACGGAGSECQEHMYERRREVVAASKALADAGYKVFVVGFGSGMPVYLTKTLEAAAYYGNTDNPEAVNSGSITGYNIPAGSTFPTGVTSCTSSTNATASCISAGSTSNTDHFKATANDPGYIDLSGYAFFADDADQLTKALVGVLSTIRESSYAFTQSSIQAVRTVDENYVYEASFDTLAVDPFWIGHLKRFSIAENGTIAATADWDAGTILQSTSAADRKIYTVNASSALKTFTTSNLTNADLAVATDVERIDIVNFIRAGELDSNYTLFGWKLGDIFHTSPMSIATPNEYFIDKIDQSTTKAFDTFRTDHVRTSANGKRVILVGANDGQLHAFKTEALSGTSGGGSELWSFIPPNLLSRLKYITHSTHPTKLTHEYFVDGPLSAAEIWIGSNQTSKSSGEWKSYLIMGEGRGGISTLWSTSTACDSGFSSAYKNYYSNGTFVPYGNYCGYYAFDVTDTSAAPVFKWRLGGNAAISSSETGIGAYLGQAWSKMFIGRVKISGVETWVGFIGGGYSGVSCTGGSGCDTRGKGFFVIKLSDGTILK